MKIFTHEESIPEEYQNAVFTIGNFDGMHKGHISLISKAIESAKDQNKPVAILTFEPHPRSIFQPNESAFRITPKDLKREKIEETGVDFLVELDFTRELAQKSADAFVQEILINQLKASHIFIGEDFQFGLNRTGSADTIRTHGIEVTTIEIIEDKNEQKHSASNVRSYLRRGMIEEANNILGWEWDIRGEVIHGDKRGREMGFPTANVALGETIHPAFGVYATMVCIDGETIWRPAATNIGIRPMFETPQALVESYIFDFGEEIYGKQIHVRPIEKIRGEARFNSLDELIVQIDQDCNKIKDILGTHKK